jgi:RimJ/RimL family protein N-acetyltransferase
VLWTIHRDVWLSRALKPEYASERTARTPHMTGPDDPAPVPDWRRRVLPMQGPGCTVREFTLQDAPALSALLGQPGVARYLSPPPDDIAGFERFIDWSHAQRALGRSLALGIVPAREERVAGILQLHSLHPRFDLAEWGFAIGERYWGTGLFQAAAQLLLTFAFEAVQVRRLEARARVDNARATQALRKLGAVPEGRLRGHDPADPDRDDILWSILDDEWLTRDASPPRCA